MSIMLRSAPLPSITITLLIIAGCTAPPKDSGFLEVQQSTSDRTDQKIEWLGSGDTKQDSNQIITAQINSMLAHDLSVDQAVQVALLNNRDLQATFEDLSIARADLVQAGLLKNPIFNGWLKLPLDGGPTGAELGVTEDFLDILFIPMRKKLSEAEFERAKLSVTGQVLDLVGQVRAAYYQVQADTQLIEMHNQIVQATGASLKMAEKIQGAGNITDLDVANERLQHQQAKLNLADAQAALAEDREHMNVLLGVWGKETTWTTPLHLPDMPGDEIDLSNIESRAIKSSLDLAIAKSETIVIAKRLGFEKFAGYLAGADSGGSDVGARSELSDGSWSLGPDISVPIPLFDQGQGRVGKASSQLRQAEQRLYARAVEIRSAARAGKTRLINARNRATYFRDEVLPLRHQMTHAMQLQYNAMLSSTFQLLMARQSEIDAGRQYVESLRDYWLARAEVQLILSGRLPASRTPSSSPSASTHNSIGGR